MLDEEMVERCAKAGYGAIEHPYDAEWEEREERKREVYRAVARAAIDAFAADDPVRRAANGVIALWDGAGGVDVDDWVVAIDALRAALAAEEGAS